MWYIVAEAGSTGIVCMYTNTEYITTQLRKNTCYII